MSPRRRFFVAACVVLGLVLGGLGAASTLRRSHDQNAPPVPQGRPGPVLLVPGYGGGVVALDRLAVVLRGTGRTVSVVHLPGTATGDLGAQARAVGTAVDAALAGGAPSVDLVGYSAGGVVARLWVAEHGGAARTRRVVTLGSPQHGADLAGLAATLAPNSCPVACQQLTPGSPLLTRLNRGDETPAGPRWVSIWTTDDQIVTPVASASLDGALDVQLQDVCPGRQVAHGQLPTDAAVQALVVRALGVATPVAPTRCPVT